LLGHSLEIEQNLVFLAEPWRDVARLGVGFRIFGFGARASRFLGPAAFAQSLLLVIHFFLELEDQHLRGCLHSWGLLAFGLTIFEF
jgi:hypothetical protein